MGRGWAVGLAGRLRLLLPLVLSLLPGPLLQAAAWAAVAADAAPALPSQLFLLHHREPTPPLPRPPSRPPAGGEAVTLPAMLPVLSGTPGGTRWAGPDLGEHTDQILREELGLGEAEIQRLRDCGAI